MYFNIAIKAGFGLNVLAMAIHMLLCLLGQGGHEHGVFGQMQEISLQGRIAGAAYIICAWLVGDGWIVESGRNTYEETVYAMQLLSVGWLAVYAFSVFSIIWNRHRQGDTMRKRALIDALAYFILSYFLY